MGRPGKGLSQGISIPSSARAADYRELVQGLPVTDAPAIFGLPANSDQAVQQVKAGYVYDNLQSMGRALNVDGGFDREKWAKELSPILKLWQQLCSANDILSA